MCAILALSYIFFNWTVVPSLAEGAKSPISGKGANVLYSKLIIY